MKPALSLCFLTLAYALSAEDSLKELEAKIRDNEAKLRALQGIRMYADKNKLNKLQSHHLDELA